MDVKETIDALLKQNREFERPTGPGSNNHIPMTLIALFRMGGSPDRMVRYVESFDLKHKTDRAGGAEVKRITQENWRDHLGRGEFPRYVDFFDAWTLETHL